MDKIKLSLGGGGSLGAVHVGVLDYIVRKDIKIDSIVSVSAGSIVAGIYAAYLEVYKKYNNYEILDKLISLVTNMDFSIFKDSNYILRVFTFLTNNINDFGIYKGDSLYHWLLTKTHHLTFADISLDLNIIATEMKNGYLTIFNKTNSPNLKIADAIRASSSIQGIYKPFKISKKLVQNSIYSNNCISSPKVDSYDLSKDVYFWDGGNLGNCRNDIALQLSSKDIPVLGISLTNDIEKDLKVINIINHTISIMMNATETLADQISNSSNTPDVIIRPNKNGIMSMDFDLTPIQIKQLISNGRVAAELGINRLNANYSNIIKL